MRIARRFEDVENNAVRAAQSYDEMKPLWQEGLEAIKKEEVDSIEGNKVAKQYASL